MAHKKGQGASRNGRDSNGQRRGIKCYEGESVQPGAIILRQCGTKFVPGFGVRIGRNCDLYAVAAGLVKFQGKKVHVLSGKGAPVAAAPKPVAKSAAPESPKAAPAPAKPAVPAAPRGAAPAATSAPKPAPPAKP